VLIIHKGRLVADGTPQDLQASFAGGQRVRFGVQAPADDVAAVLQQWGRAHILEQHANGGTEVLFTLSAAEDDDVRPALFHLAVDRGWTLTELHQDQVNLEDVFRQLTAA
jgi:ABC-2 type transport system ATP-binding protein